MDYILQAVLALLVLRDQDQSSRVTAVGFWKKKPKNTLARRIEYRNAAMDLKESGWNNQSVHFKELDKTVLSVFIEKN